jgi:TetR/AcrR family transcriptional regulator
MDHAERLIEDAPEPETGGRVRQRNVARILAAAERVFAARGFQGASMSKIAREAGLPKANLHYYFGTKEAIYRALIANVLEQWITAFGEISEDDDPAEALERYIRAKLELARQRPLASRVFAMEVLQGAPILRPVLEQDLRRWVEDKARVMRRWAERGLMDPVDPAHLLFLIWAATQTYADFDVQVRAVLGRAELSDADYETAVDTLTHIVLKGCGVKP